MKKNLLFLALVCTLVLGSTNQAYAGWFFGKKQYREDAFTYGDCVYIRHYYEHRFFGFTVGELFFEDELVSCN